MLDNIGLTESERGFARWLGTGQDIVRDHRRLGGWSRVHPITARRLRARLLELRRHLPPGLAHEVGEVVAKLDAADAVARSLMR